MSVSDNLRQRFRIFFRFIDLNKDGVLCRGDIDKLLVNICHLYKASKKELDVIHVEIDAWWTHMEPLAVNGDIQEEDYVKVMEELLENDPVRFRQSICKGYDLLFNIIDRNNDNQISLSEFKKYYASYKVTDKTTIKKIFRQMDLNLDDSVTRDEWILAHLNYMTCDDPHFDHGFLYKVNRHKDDIYG